MNVKAAGLSSDGLKIVETLKVGEHLTSPNGAYTLTLQADGNLVEKRTSDGVVVWNSLTVAKPVSNGYYAVMAGDGNFLVLDGNNANAAVWGTYTAGKNANSVRLLDDGNLSVFSGSQCVWYSDIIPPTIPTALSSPSKGSNFINLSWKASSDNLGVAGYNIYKNGAYVGTTTTTSYTVTGLTSSITYSFTLRARDAAGNVSGLSNVCSVATDPVLGSYIYNQQIQNMVSQRGTREAFNQIMTDVNNYGSQLFVSEFFTGKCRCPEV